MAMAATALATSTCYYDKKELLYPSGFDCTGVQSTFSADVLPLIQSSCAQGTACHGSGSGNGPGALTTYSQIRSAVAQIISSVEAGRMPLGAPLTAEKVKVISCWAGNGTLNN